MEQSNNLSDDWDERTSLELDNAIDTAEIRGLAEVKIELSKIKERKKALNEDRKLEEKRDRGLTEKLSSRIKGEGKDSDNVGRSG